MKDGTKKYITISRDNGYYFGYNGIIYSDSDNYEEAVKNDLEERMKSYSSSKVLMEDGEWKITRKLKIEYYLDLIKKKVENLEDISDVIKKVSASTMMYS